MSVKTPKERPGARPEAPDSDRRKRVLAFFHGSSNPMMFSLGVHAIIFFAIGFLPFELQHGKKHAVRLIQKFEDFIEEIEMPEIRDLEVEDMAVEVDESRSESTDVAAELMVVQESAELESVDIDGELVVEEGLDAGMDGGKLTGNVPQLLGVGELNETPGEGLPFGYRSRSAAGRRAALKRHCGEGTMDAVELALKWLAHHQEPDGSWNATLYEGKHEDRVSMTGVAVLAFLGAGYSEHVRPYQATLRRAIQYLNLQVSEKKDRPHFGNNYGSAIALMALAESSIFGSKSATHGNANLIAQMFIDMYKGQGWEYQDGGFDFSVSGWVALGLKSAQAADLPAMKTPEAIKMFEQYKKWVQTMSSNDTGLGRYRPDRETSPQMTWVGMFQRQFLGFSRSDPFLVKAQENSDEWIESGKWVGSDVPGDIYGIYYGTLSAFQQQGKFWKAWNHRMKNTLLHSQEKGDPRGLGGSWGPTSGVVGENGGRVMTTALACLCLEVYYRYELMN